MDDMQKLRIKERMQSLRDPAKFNAETFAQEYGEVPK